MDAAGRIGRPAGIDRESPNHRRIGRAAFKIGEDGDAEVFEGMNAKDARPFSCAQAVIQQQFDLMPPVVLIGGREGGPWLS